MILSKARIFAEAGDLFAGSKMPERLATTVFKSVGIAVGISPPRGWSTMPLKVAEPLILQEPPCRFRVLNGPCGVQQRLPLLSRERTSSVSRTTSEMCQKLGPR